MRLSVVAVDGQVVHARRPRPSPSGHPRHGGGDPAAAQVPQLVEGAGLDRPALADDRDPVGQPLDLAEDVAGQQHRRARGDPLGDAVGEDLLHQRVQPGRRLVEHEQVRRRRRTPRPGRPSGGCPWSTRGPSWSGRGRSAPAAPRGGPARGRRRASAAAGRWSRRRTGWARGRRHRARRRAAGGSPPRRATGRGRTRVAVPPSTRSSPSSARIVVDLPAPFGPRKPCTSPARTSRSRPSSARCGPKRLDQALDVDHRRHHDLDNTLLSG